MCQAYIRLKLLTGLGQTDMLSIRISDMTDAGLRVAQSKTGRKQLFVSTPELRRAFDDARALGYVSADRLLQQVAMRLRACIRRSDTACRNGGDELVILLPDIETPDQTIAATTRPTTRE
jgi:GGDEF domain-containing protein